MVNNQKKHNINPKYILLKSTKNIFILGLMIINQDINQSLFSVYDAITEVCGDVT